MHDTDRKQVEAIEKLSGEYRIRFRYELWSHASQDFCSSRAVVKRFKSIVINGAGNVLNSGAAEPEGVSASDAVTNPRNVR
jgi:hypothetical protein